MSADFAHICMYGQQLTPSLFLQDMHINKTVILNNLLKITRLYVQYIDDIDHLKNSTHCTALCQIK